MGSNGVWLNAACSEIYYPRENILTYLFQIIGNEGKAHRPHAKPESAVTLLTTQHARHHGCTSVVKASCGPVTRLPLGPPGEIPGSCKPCHTARDHALPLGHHMPTAGPVPYSAGASEGSRPSRKRQMGNWTETPGNYQEPSECPPVCQMLCCAFWELENQPWGQTGIQGTEALTPRHSHAA